jgi:hypothetical protein
LQDCNQQYSLRNRALVRRFSRLLHLLLTSLNVSQTPTHFHFSPHRVISDSHFVHSIADVTSVSSRDSLVDRIEESKWISSSPSALLHIILNLPSLPRDTSPRKNSHSLRSTTNAELRYRKDRRFSSRTHHLAQNTVSTISTHLHHFLRLHSSYASCPRTRSPIVFFSASKNISSSFLLRHDLRMSFLCPSFRNLTILHIPLHYLLCIFSSQHHETPLIQRRLQSIRRSFWSLKTLTHTTVSIPSIPQAHF